MQGLAGQLLFRRWWEGPGGGPRAGLANLLAWSPWPKLAVEIVLGLCALALLATVVWSVVFAIRPVPRDPGERDDQDGRGSRSSQGGTLALATVGGDGDTTGVDGPTGGHDWFSAGPVGLGGQSRLGPDHPPSESEQTMSIPRRPGAHRHRRG